MTHILHRTWIIMDSTQQMKWRKSMEAMESTPAVLKEKLGDFLLENASIKSYLKMEGPATAGEL